MLFQSRINQHFSAAGIVVPQFKVSSGSSLSYGGFASFPWDVLLQKARNGRALERPRGRDMLNESTFTLDHFTTRRFFHSALPRDVLFLSPKNDNLSGPIARYFQHPEPRHYSAHRCFGYFVLDLIWTDDPQEASRSPTCACPAQEAQTPPENVFVPVPASPQSALVCTPGPISLPDQRSAPSTVSYASLDRRSALETPSQSASSGMRSTPQSSVALPLFLPDEDQASRHPSRSPEPANTTRNLPRSEAPPTPTVAPSIPVDEMDDDERVEPFGHPSRLPDVIDMDSDAEGRAAVKSWMRKLSNCFPPIIEDTKALKGHATAKESTPGENTLALASNVIAQLRMIYKGDASFETSEGFIRFDPRVELWNQGCTIRGMMCSAMTFDAFRS
ncbi:hypothetical protein BOTBODRAFT_288200 [Botryobasidium botryosum FD-172 SS1]|uniref:Uncharacterized protein n=1 Tax=Botryobasidium botryosum (strain FD-172 SS1) TaxID=930990 RepID=A0A067LS85_BOTB1|nr:hypothetical protein BOTBODRAFT_288200 [Botryobasidium botryosum FD-172 SS1]